MPQAKTKTSPVPTARPDRIRPTATAFALEPGNLKPSGLKLLNQRRGHVTKVLADYAQAAADADARGEPTRFTIVVEPTRRADAAARTYGDQLADARERGAARVGEILGDPAMLSSDAMAALIGASRETVNQRRRAGELLGLEGATRGVRYPHWQLSDDGRPLAGLAAIGRALGSDAWAVYRFLVGTHPELEGMTGLDALRAGRTDEALLVAEGIAQGSFA